MGSERKTQFPIRRRFFDPGVCVCAGNGGRVLACVPISRPQIRARGLWRLSVKPLASVDFGLNRVGFLLCHFLLSGHGL